MIESIVETDADNIVRNPAADGSRSRISHQARATGPAIAIRCCGKTRANATEINMEILDFHAPVAGENVLRPDTKGPPSLDGRIAPIGERTRTNDWNITTGAGRHSRCPYRCTGDYRRSAVLDLTDG